MNPISRTSLIVLVVFCSLLIVEGQSRHRSTKKKTTSCTQGTAYRGCVACGTTKLAKNRALNVLKNRSTAVANPTAITVEAIRDPANDTGTFTPQKKVKVTGFVAGVDPGGLK